MGQHLAQRLGGVGSRGVGTSADCDGEPIAADVDTPGGGRVGGGGLLAAMVFLAVPTPSASRRLA
jgi:hypothetical protein